MRHRRFLLLSGVLVALNLFLWLAPQGLALQRIAISSLFGNKLVRAEVIESSGADWRVDRGVIAQVSPTQVTLREVDGHTQTIVLAPSTRVVGAGRFGLAQGWRVLVTWPANGAANTVKVEKKTRVKTRGRGTGQVSSIGSRFDLAR